MVKNDEYGRTRREVPFILSIRLQELRITPESVGCLADPRAMIGTVPSTEQECLPLH
jgi:hypothetical protein